MNIIGILREDADICYNGIKEIPCMSCPSKPEGGMFSMVSELNKCACMFCVKVNKIFLVINFCYR